MTAKENGDASSSSTASDVVVVGPQSNIEDPNGAPPKEETSETQNESTGTKNTSASLNGENADAEEIGAGVPAFSPNPSGVEIDVNKLLRGVRAEVQEIRNVIILVQDGKLTLKSQAPYLTISKADLVEMRGLLSLKIVGNATADNSDTANISDAIAHLVNLLGQMEHSPLLADSANDLPAQEQTNAIVILLDQVRQVERLVGLLTIPARLNRWLSNSKPGYYVPFNLIFQDEIPTEEDRRTVLNHIAWSPAVVENGIVDVGNGLVFRYSPVAAERWRSVLSVVGALILSLIIVMGSAYLPVPGWDTPPAAQEETPASQEEGGTGAGTTSDPVGGGLTDAQRATVFAVAWGAVLLGVVAHIGVAQAKRERETNLPVILAAAGFTETIDARRGQILLKLLLILIGVFAVIFAIDPTASPINAFLVGYSLDSVIELFSQNVEGKVATMEKTLKV